MKSNHTNGNSGGNSKGIGFFGMLQVAFIVLKLCNVINWSWWLVMLPAMVCFFIWVVLLGVFLWLVGRN